MVQKPVISAPASIRISFLITAPIRAMVHVRDAKSTGVRACCKTRLKEKRRLTRSLSQFNSQLSGKIGHDIVQLS